MTKLFKRGGNAEPKPAPARRARRGVNWPLLGWAAIGLLALGYLADLGAGTFGFSVPWRAQPDALPRLHGKTQASWPAFAGKPAGSTDVGRLSDEVARLREETAQLGERVAKLEGALGPATGALSPAQVKRPVTPADETRTATKKSRDVEMSFAPMPDEGFGDEMLTKSPVPIAGSTPSTRTKFGVRVGDGATRKDIESAWKKLQEKNAPYLAGLEARTSIELDDKGTKRWSLIAGPFDDAADAATMCARLKSGDTPCRQTVFAGEPLSPDMRELSGVSR